MQKYVNYVKSSNYYNISVSLTKFFFYLFISLQENVNLHKYLSFSYNFILCRDTISSHFLRYQFAVNDFAMSKCII